MNVLEIRQPYIKRLGTKSRLCSDITWGVGNRTLWFEVEREYEKCLCSERIDGFLVALLPFAMIANLNIFSDGYISERLLYQLKTILLPSLVANIADFHSIDIKAKFDGKVLDCKNAVGTGLTCGIDSFYTVLKHVDECLEGFRLTNLTYFNIMNSAIWQGREDSSREFSNARIDYVKPAADELGLKLVTVDSNLDGIYRGFNYLATFTFRFFGTILALQKLFGKYYWSSGHTFSQFKLTIDDIAYFDLLSVQCLSNENTTFYSVGSEITRIEKTEYISDFAITYKFLNVCWSYLYNCGKCDKCRRTMLGLYALGKLNYYREVFDVGYFYQNKDEYLGHMLFMWITEKDHGYYSEIRRYLRQRYIKIPARAKMCAIKLLYNATKKKIKRTMESLT